ncbi:hypothetical protein CHINAEXTREME_20515 (plasmid) [Halobiforma lacisalsi AJ5]|uniref:Uncharacterized protein n=1 Tax=Natronobacterium lacisalsi AJ5 TaxID=358396 RepID=A0A1P8LWS3_NATLA|nr:hypothetical protein CHINAEXTREME_20515 [Halobiforma lacisalsi AJ5]
MTREIPNPITAVVSTIGNFVLFVWVAFRAGIRKLFTPARWDFGDQLRRAPEDVRTAGQATPHVLRNALENVVEFIDVRDRGNDGPRR